MLQMSLDAMQSLQIFDANSEGSTGRGFSLFGKSNNRNNLLVRLDGPYPLKTWTTALATVVPTADARLGNIARTPTNHCLLAPTAKHALCRSIARLFG